MQHQFLFFFCKKCTFGTGYFSFNFAPIFFQMGTRDIPNYFIQILKRRLPLSRSKEFERFRNRVLYSTWLQLATFTLRSLIFSQWANRTRAMIIISLSNRRIQKEIGIDNLDMFFQAFQGSTLEIRHFRGVLKILSTIDNFQINFFPLTKWRYISKLAKICLVFESDTDV